MPDPDRVVILNDFASAEGGAGYLASRLAEGVAARGVPVTFITGDDPAGAALPGVTPLGLGGAGLLASGAARAAVKGLRNREVLAQMRALIAAHDTPGTIYHLHNWSNILSPAIFDALAPVADRCVIHAHDFFLACPNGAFLDYPRAAICRRVPLSLGCVTTNCDKRAYSHKLWRVVRNGVLATALRPHLKSASFVLIHEAMRPWLAQSLPGARFTAIRNPVTPFGPLAPAPEAQRGIAHIGQVQRLKGVFELAAAGERLGQQIEFFGSGEDLDDLRRRYPSHLWHGHTDRAVVGQRLQRMRAVVVASQSPEPFCMAAFESIATGLPLVLSDAILAAPELRDSGAALTFPAADTDALTATLRRVLADDVMVATMAAAALRSGPALSHGLPDWVDAHLALYATLTQPDPLPAQMGGVPAHA
ncbi:glycosyltransferase [Paracoccus jeotgali]|uniref:Glycosyl transferase family 1 n=1 Tax=Paracoccus jeotgali TaxID=2065379 RepID=A0A2K9MF74_9RHOB|nr:glycosyltransferase [Paracoccus jeotgali]AUM74270.1 glycosyl transferase family 1 [Paracoccus jeotgali]